MSGSVTVSNVRGMLEGEKAAAQEQNPVVVLAVGDKSVQTKALKGPGKRPVWQDAYTIDDVPLDQPLILTVTAYDVSDAGNCHKPIGSGTVRLDASPSMVDDLVVYLADPTGHTIGHLDFHLTARLDYTSPEGPGGPGTSQRGYAARKEEEAPDQARAGGPATPPAKGGRPPGIVEREYQSIPMGQEGPVCEEKTYTVVEDCPVEKERRTVVREVRRVEKHFVIETRFVAERELPHLTTTEVLRREEHVLSAKQSSPCEGAPELVMQET